MMEQVEDFSLESVLAIIFHYYNRADRRVEVVQRVENISVFRDTRLPSDVASCLALLFWTNQMECKKSQANNTSMWKALR